MLENPETDRGLALFLHLNNKLTRFTHPFLIFSVFNIE